MHISHLDFFYELPIQDVGFYPKSMESNWRALCRGVRQDPTPLSVGAEEVGRRQE